MADKITGMSAFRARADASAIESATSVPDVLPPSSMDELKEVPDSTDENLLVIPISREVAADFVLIGYDETIRHIEEVLSQKGKRRNVLLFGDNGVGKTALLQGLVQRKNRGDLSTHMYKRTFYRLNTSKLLHTDDVTEINKQFYQALTELGQYDVLVIENVYTLVLYLKAKGVNAVLVAFLEALSRRKLQAIITCSSREKSLLTNEVPEVHEYFSSEKVSEANNDELLNILRGVRKSYEARYGVAVPDLTICTIRDLTQKWRNGLEEWAQPGRALILLDRAIAQFSVRMNSKPDELNALENEADNATNEIQSLDSSADENDVERRTELTTRLKEMAPRLTELRNKWQETTAPIRALQTEKSIYDKKLHEYTIKRREFQDMRGDSSALAARSQDLTTVNNEIASYTKSIDITLRKIKEINGQLTKINLADQRNHTVTPEAIANTFSALSGISVAQLSENERERVLKMEEIIGERVFGQPEAIGLVSNAVRRAKADLSEGESTPKGSFLFLGPSGVGKTELGKALAEFETGTEKNLIRLDMSEYMERHAVSKMIGAPPGYAGYESGGSLTEAVRARPKSIVMFDEVEKAHPDIFKILLQILGDARLTDGRGDTVDFRECYVVLTSNAGTPHFLNEKLSYEQAAVLAGKEVESFLLPEIRGRLDSIICFRRLELPMLERVAKKRIKAINERIDKRNLRLDIDDTSIHAFCEVAQDARYGARSILKALKTTLEKELATEILGRTGNGGGGIFKATFTDKFALTFEPELDHHHHKVNVA